MADIRALYTKHKDLSDDDQKNAGKAIAGKMGELHEAFLKTIVELVKAKEIDFFDPPSMLKASAFEKLSEKDQEAIGLSLFNLLHQVERIYKFFISTDTPNESPQLQTMIEHLWQMKERIEKKYGDVLKI